MVKVVHLITLLEFGGAQGNTIHTCAHLDRKRFEPHLWSGRGGYWDKEVEEKLPGRVRFLPHLVRPLHPLFDLWATIELWWALRRLKPHILHTHSSKAGILGRIAGKLAGVPVIVHTFHGFGFNPIQKPWVRWFFVELERAAARLSTALIFVSEANWAEAKKRRLGRESQYVLIRSGVPLDAIRKQGQSSDPKKIKEELGVPPTGQVVTTICPFKPQKNLTDFIELAHRVAPRFPNAYFVVIGDGALRPHLEEKIESLGFRGRVLLLGWRGDAARILSISDAFVLTSLWEGLPRALVEALALGIPAVCYDTDGVRDLLAKGGGTVVPARNLEGMVDPLLRLLQDRKWAMEVGAQGRALIGREFDIDFMVRQQEELYINLFSVSKGSLDNRDDIN